MITFIVVGSIFFILATISSGKHEVNGGKPIAIFYTPGYVYLVGWIYFLFEGILNVLPVMNASTIHVHQNFHYILAAALGTLCFLYSSYSAIAYYYFGSRVYGNMLDYFYLLDVVFFKGKYPISIFLEVMYILNLYFAIPSSIFPVTSMIDSFLSSKIKNSQCSDLIGKFLKGFFIIIISITCSKFINNIKNLWAILGLVLGTYLTVFIPNLCHYKLLATHKEFGSKG